ncbi:hypothetical protein C6A88_00075, partial [Mycolicibacterium austroafricanum]
GRRGGAFGDQVAALLRQLADTVRLAGPHLHPLEHGDIAVLQGMKVWTRQADGVRELAQQRRDLITESATAAAT